MTLYNSQGNYLIAPELSLDTKKGRNIPNELSEQRPAERMNAAKEIILRNHPSISVRSLSSAYNCMGMVFANRRVWVDPENLPMILDDDEYQKIAGEEQLQPGDVVVYRNSEGEVSHVGIVAQIRVNIDQASWEITVLSQWSRDGEYFHKADDVNPLLGKPVEYWTDRV